MNFRNISNQIRQMEARDAEMRRLRLDNGWTLDRIAKKFHLTRERVRQVVGNTGGWRYPKVEK